MCVNPELTPVCHPSLCVVAGTTERRGSQRIGHTFVVNPGRLADGSGVWLDWNRGKDEPVEFLTL
jgi:Icc-related predicted phosphoesterase